MCLGAPIQASDACDDFTGQAACEDWGQKLPLVKTGFARGDSAVLDLAPIKLLGAGGFANVFLCRDQRTGEILALKALIKSLLLQKRKLKQVAAVRSRDSLVPNLAAASVLP